ncbi:UNVERIFIED_ORG: protein-S-isoprenylcysteine O-methyltransferase Ste14 [Xanthobacter viscosus]|jgi:protein-S-isoprenylcysteine O-methyltransferase Ste14|uniref:Isoprenylcysteine carboxylmethyltransferase family protein n=1 Tax=Xanthobacter autotrophicus TaxID=280 RepID=A0A6C1KB13_XANAU|nr:methyltransferase [Xanthobacter autotrophicus]TLX41458.1 isoprenylcysteine carboxylmethyltransferase family protein [Xanthobacter autotrophicus]
MIVPDATPPDPCPPDPCPPDACAARPNRLPWPPMIYGGALAAALALGALAPSFWPPLLAGPAVRGGGAVVAGLGLGLDLWAIVTLHRARTNILPHRAADRLVTSGPFALSRNPIYLGNTLLLLGLGMALANGWLLAAALLAALATDRLAARREERHLAAKFGAAFDAYAARVPRWIGWWRASTPPPPPGPDRN